MWVTPRTGAAGGWGSSPSPRTGAESTWAAPGSPESVVPPHSVAHVSGEGDKGNSGLNGDGDEERGVKEADQGTCAPASPRPPECAQPPPPLVRVGVVKAPELDVNGKETVVHNTDVERVAVAEAAAAVVGGGEGKRGEQKRVPG